MICSVCNKIAYFSQKEAQNALTSCKNKGREESAWYLCDEGFFHLTKRKNWKKQYKEAVEETKKGLRIIKFKQ